MPSWSKKDERKYEAIKASELKRGEPQERAEEIAARTVNKGRRKEGRTPNKRTQGTGNPDAPLGELTRDELYNRAKEAKIVGRAKMSKSDLIQALGKN